MDRKNKSKKVRENKNKKERALVQNTRNTTNNNKEQSKQELSKTATVEYLFNMYLYTTPRPPRSSSVTWPSRSGHSHMV